MAGSCYLFQSFNNNKLKKEDIDQEFKIKEEEKYNKENKDFEQDLVFIHDLYGVLKCNLLLLRLHEIESLESDIIELIDRHIYDIFQYYHQNKKKLQKFSIYITNLIDIEYNQWKRQLNNPLFSFFVFFVQYDWCLGVLYVQKNEI